MSPFPAWMGSYPWTSSSSSGYQLDIESRSTIKIPVFTTKPRRRLPNSAFGSFQEVKVTRMRTIHFGPDRIRTNSSSFHPHKNPFKRTSGPTTPIAKLSNLYTREWEYMTRGRWGRIRSLEWAVPLLIFVGTISIGLWLDRRYKREMERKRVAEKEREDWGLQGFN